MDDREAELVDYLDLLWRRKWLVVLGTLACVLAAGLGTWQWPKTYVVQTTIDTGDVTESQVKDVERLVARLNATPVFDGEGGSIALTAEYRKPLVIELRAETRAPAQAAKTLEQVAARTVEDLGRLLRAGRERDEARLVALQLQMEAVNTEAESVLAELRADVEQRIREARGGLRTLKAELEEANEERTALERRVQALARNLEEVRSARLEAVRGVDGPARAVVTTTLTHEITTKEAELVTLERELRVELPARTRELEARAQQLTERLAALDAVKAALAGRRATGPYDLSAFRSAVYRAALATALDLQGMSTAARRVEVELVERLRTLKNEADALSQKAEDVRLARVIAPPVVPRAPVRPRLGLSLAVAFVAGLMGSVLLVFVVEYVRAPRAGHRRTDTGAAGSRTPPAPPR